MLSRFLRLQAILGVASVSVHADITRHNEQGLSPTHTYKRSGPQGVVSNLNGNLVIRLDPVKKSGAPFGVQITRAYNSHWREPLLLQQYDMDFNAIDYGSTDATKHHAKYDNISTSAGQSSVSPFAHRRIFKIDNPSSFPLTWQNVALMGSDEIRAGIKSMLVAGVPLPRSANNLFPRSLPWFELIREGLALV